MIKSWLPSDTFFKGKSFQIFFLIQPAEKEAASEGGLNYKMCSLLLFAHPVLIKRIVHPIPWKAEKIQVPSLKRLFQWVIWAVILDMCFGLSSVGQSRIFGPFEATHPKALRAFFMDGFPITGRWLSHKGCLHNVSVNEIHRWCSHYDKTQIGVEKKKQQINILACYNVLN